MRGTGEACTVAESRGEKIEGKVCTGIFVDV